MKKTLLILAMLLLATLAAAQAAPATRFREIDWLALVPKDWKPQEVLDRKKAQSLNDGDALAQEMMKELRAVLDAAPTVNGLDGAAIRLPGFMVPLEQSKEGITEFLLVPYHGACIHTPPPPANQIVHVRSRAPVKGFQTMSAVWVTGVLNTARKDSGMGVSGYGLELAGIEAYRPQ
jgi:hypothetical protein